VVTSAFHHWKNECRKAEPFAMASLRAEHRKWSKNGERPDPIDLLRKSEMGRIRELLPIRYERMLQSPFNFYRGAAAVMAADLAGTPATGMRVQACGDCRLLNFGGFATPERNILFDINDFDEALPAPLDVLVLGARLVQFPGGRFRRSIWCGSVETLSLVEEARRMLPR